MSLLLQGNGDDHPEAAGKHLADAALLCDAGRADGCSYLSGYVVECSLKALVQHETGVAPFGHDLRKLAAQVSAVQAVAGAKIARYLTPPVLTLPSARIAAWDPQIRYRPPGTNLADANRWLQEAQAAYEATVMQMRLDGVL